MFYCLVTNHSKFGGLKQNLFISHLGGQKSRQCAIQLVLTRLKLRCQQRYFLFSRLWEWICCQAHLDRWLNFVLAARGQGPCVTADGQFRDLSLLLVAASTSPHGLQVAFPAAAGLMHTLWISALPSSSRFLPPMTPSCVPFLDPT